MRHIKTRNKRKKKFSILFCLFMILFLGGFVFSAYKIVIWKMDNDKGNQTLKVIKDDIKIIKNKDTDQDEYVVDFDSLKNKNKDTVAFIKVNGTNIEYPVVKTNNNDYYLTHSFDKTINSAGWVFANYTLLFDGTDRNITIFAHSRRDGSMFGTLYQTLSKEWQSDQEHFNITFITEKGTDTYQVFSTYKILNEDYYIQNNFTDDEYIQFLDTIRARSNYDYHVDLSKDDSILTLSTCASDDKYRIVLHAKKL